MSEQGDDDMKLGEIFRTQPARDAHGLQRAWTFTQRDAFARPMISAGLIAGTQVATGLGWRKIEAVQEGDKVLTFDDGLQAVQRLERSFIDAHRHRGHIADAPICVPEGALGNRDALLMLPDQPVMVESDLGEEMFGDPFTLVPAMSLIGFKGIRQHTDIDVFEVVTLYFETEQVVFANVGALFYCPSYSGADMLHMADESNVPGYEVLSPENARKLVAAMIREDASDAIWSDTGRHQPAHARVA